MATTYLKLGIGRGLLQAFFQSGVENYWLAAWSSIVNYFLYGGMVERIVSRAIWDSQFRRKRHSSKLRLDSSVKLTLRCLSKYLVGYLAVGHTITEMFSEPSHPSSTNDNGVLVPSSAHQVSFAISTIHLAKLSVSPSKL